MTPFQTIIQLERKAHKLGMKYKDGTPLDDCVAMGRVGVFHDKRYDFVIDSLDQGLITIEEYFLEMMRMITEYSTRERDPGPWDKLMPRARGFMF